MDNKTNDEAQFYKQVMTVLVSAGTAVFLGLCLAAYLISADSERRKNIISAQYEHEIIMQIHKCEGDENE